MNIPESVVVPTLIVVAGGILIAVAAYYLGRQAERMAFILEPPCRAEHRTEAEKLKIAEDEEAEDEKNFQEARAMLKAGAPEVIDDH